MVSTALVSAEISLPARPEGLRVRERIAALSETVDIVGLTDNHAGLPRMSPLAAVALAREQGAAAVGSEGILCLQGDRVDGIAHVGDLSTARLIEAARRWVAPLEIAVGAVVNPFAVEPLRDRTMADRARSLPGCLLPDRSYERIAAGDGLRLASELAGELAARPGVDALHLFPLGAETATSDIAAAFRGAR